MLTTHHKHRSSFSPSQIEYFGLQYSNKNYQLRWVDLEKPLKKQLEKYTQDPVLKFGVMLYAPNMQSLKQEITRYCVMLSSVSHGVGHYQPVTVASS